MEEYKMIGIQNIEKTTTLWVGKLFQNYLGMSKIKISSGRGVSSGGVSLVVFSLVLFTTFFSVNCASSGAKTETESTLTPVSNDLVPNLSSIEILASPRSYTFTINTDQNWQITGIPDWLSVNPTSGSAGVANLVTITTSIANTVSGLSATLTIHGSLSPTSPVITRSLALTRSIFDRCGGDYGIPGPSVMLFKYLNKTNPNPSEPSSTNAEMAFIVVRGCGDTTTTVQSVFSTLRYVKIRDTRASVNLGSLSIINQPWDHFEFSISKYLTHSFRFIPENAMNIKNGTGIALTYDSGAHFFYDCIASNCFIRINNNIVTLPDETGLIPGIVSFNRFSEDANKLRGVRLLSTELLLNSSNANHPAVREAINDMYTKYAERADVTWPVTWRTVLIP